MKKITIALVQTENRLVGASENAERMANWIERAAAEEANVVMFPEGCLTGYSTSNVKTLAIRGNDPAIARVEACAHEAGLAVGFGFIEQNENIPSSNSSSEGSTYDMCGPAGSESSVERFASGSKCSKPFVTYIVSAPGERLVYRKTHLGSREARVFAAGDELPVAEIAGVRMGVQLCWEAHIPQITTTLRAKGAELVLMPHASGLPIARRLELWDRYLPARAYDNGLFVAACNALMPAPPTSETALDSQASSGGVFDVDGERWSSGPAGDVVDPEAEHWSGGASDVFDAKGEPKRWSRSPAGDVFDAGCERQRWSSGASDDAEGNHEHRGGGAAAYGPDGTCLARSDFPSKESVFDQAHAADECMLIANIGGALPRETPDQGMSNVSYFDRLRPELYCLG